MLNRTKIPLETSRLNVRLDEKDRQILEQYCREKNLSKSDLIRKFISELEQELSS
ncbi:MAG: DUF6290 family protein [Halobacteria archaeon]